MHDHDATTETEVTASLVRGLLAALPPARAAELARGWLDAHAPAPPAHHVDTGERQAVASLFDGLPPER